MIHRSTANLPDSGTRCEGCSLEVRKAGAGAEVAQPPHHQTLQRKMAQALNGTAQRRGRMLTPPTPVWDPSPRVVSYEHGKCSCRGNEAAPKLAEARTHPPPHVGSYPSLCRYDPVASSMSNVVGAHHRAGCNTLETKAPFSRDESLTRQTTTEP